MAKRGRKKKRTFGLNLGFRIKKSTLQSVLAIFLFLLSAISIFSYLQQGHLPTQLNLLLVKYLGFFSIFLPFLLLHLGLVFSKIKSPLKDTNVFVGFLLTFVSLLGLFRQGLAGQFFWSESSFLITPFGALLVFFGGTLIGIVVLFNTSLAQLLSLFQKILKNLKRYSIGLEKKGKGKKDARFAGEQLKIDNKPSPPPSLPSSPPPQSSSDLPQQTLTSSPGQAQIWQYPPLSILDTGGGTKADRGDIRKNASTIEQTLESFGITARVSEINKSPSVTQYALEVALGTKLSKVVSLSNDLALALAAPTGQIRIEAPIPGRSLVGIEVPNKSLELVPMRTIMDDDVMKKSGSKLTIPLGLGVSGEPSVADITRMPHVLIAGQTGSGKSVCVNSWISSILFRASPQEVRMIMVDPKRVELTRYNGIPHLLTPVIVEPDRVLSSLEWAASEMERRYKLFAEVGARNIESYNNMAGFQSLPLVIFVIDELADIMLYAPAEIEDKICRIAQMARATGIHLVLATQRPSVDVLTGLIKANIPTRIAFAVASVTDSRVILDTPGAEKLLGRGDMLYTPPDLAKPLRFQGAFISDTEVGKLVDFLKKQQTPEYDQQILSQPVAAPGGSKTFLVDGEERDEKFEEAINLVISTGKASASLLQRRLKLGYARAARVLDQLERAGIVGPADGAKPREILSSAARPSPDQI
jgi:DNA segregation ATPase FtsK/SpoIIIE, S-DNA-T family